MMQVKRANLEDQKFIETLVNTKISSYKIKNGCEEGDNVAGSLKSIKILTQNGEEINTIFKIIPEDSPPWIIELKIFRTEHAVYRTLSPLMKQFATSRGLPEYEPPIPKYFNGFNDDKNDYICLQDLRPLGFKMPDKKISRTLPEMVLILKEFAKFHAISYALIQYEGDQLFQKEDMINILNHRPKDKTGFDEMIKMYYEETTKIMEERNPELAKHMKPFISDSWKIWRTTEYNPKYFQTLIHFDLWTNNILIKYNEATGEPIDVKFIDFQFVKKGNIFSDLQYLIFTSTTPEFRKDHLISVLGTYFDEFVQILDALKCPHPFGFTKGFLIDEFYKCFLPGFTHMTFAIPLQLGDLSPGDHLEGGYDPVKAMRNYYLRSPLALNRLDSLIKELIDMKII